jgi:biofilm PGA synthesis protein PgaA
VLALTFLGTALSPHAGAQEAGQQSPSPLNDASAKRLQRLKEQADRNPGNRNFLYDYMQALDEAGRDEALLALRPRVDSASAPATVLARMGRAASNLKQFPLAVEIFESALAKAPERTDIVAGLSYALIDAGRPADAQRLLESRKAQLERQVPLLEAHAEALRAQREHAQALLDYERILALDPGNRAALRNRVFVVAQLGAPHRALELAEQTPGLLSDAELSTLQAERAAIAARWGMAADPDGPDRFAATDAALAENETLLAAAAPGSAQQRRLQFDRVVLLRNRYRMQEAVALYESLDSAAGGIPAYVQAAAADAYLYLEKPEQARDLYRAAIAQGDTSPSPQYGLFYAYDDATQYKEALAQIDGMVDAMPRKVRAYSPLTVADNPEYASAVATAGSARSYQDYQADAQRRLEEFRDLAPWNMEGREKLATLYAARGWPRRSEEEHLWILAAEPRYRQARIGYTDNLRELRDWRAAEKATLDLEAEFPEDKQVQRLSRLWRIHEMRELQVEAGKGDSSGSGGPLGSSEHQIETWLYSAPYKYDWRAFLHQYEAQASFPSGDGHWRRIGAGAEYRVRDWRARAEVAASYDDDSDVGFSLAGDWQKDDHWNFEVGFDSSSNDIPLEGRPLGVRGWSLRAGATYRVSESRRFSAGVQTLDFNDGNNRDILFGSAFQRLVTGPVFKLDGLVNVGTSRNTLQGAPYFNPESDLDAGVTLIGEQRLWRRYYRSFLHRLYLMAGNYWQENFSSGATGGIRYEHEWSIDDRFGLLYGVQRTFHPYDGLREYMTYYNLALNWKF